MLHDTGMDIKVAIARLICDRCDEAHSHRLTISMLADVLLHGYRCQGCVDMGIRRYHTLGLRS